MLSPNSNGSLVTVPLSCCRIVRCDNLPFTLEGASQMAPHHWILWHFTDIYIWSLNFSQFITHPLTSKCLIYEFRIIVFFFSLDLISMLSTIRDTKTKSLRQDACKFLHAACSLFKLASFT
jgi:hypothetical protein